jgi:3-oxoacyl-(acyl-carrier-protein) synthase
MSVYIKNSAAVSPQESFSKNFSLKQPSKYSEKFTCIEPIYKEHIPPMKLRRMNRLVKMVLATAKNCLGETNGDELDGIITGSGWGCLTDTYKFLNEIEDGNISSPSPATFIQSTHNTPGGQLALHLGCRSYNNVLVNGNTSFEHAIMDGLMLLSEGKRNILVGAFDELTETDFQLKSEAGFWKIKETSSSSFISENSPGTMAGEGAAFFLLDNEPGVNPSKLHDSKIINSLPEAEQVQAAINNFLAKNGKTLDDIDLILSGANGEQKIMPLYNNLNKEVFTSKIVIDYKQYCGEYDTSAGFALWLAHTLLTSESLIKEYKTIYNSNPPENILIYNYAGTQKHAVTYISKAGI